jgi:hypothetical protein
MNARLLAAACAGTVAVAVAVAPAAAAPKTMKQSYDVELPVPFPVMEGMADFNGCWNGQEGLSKHSKEITLPAPGLFKAQVTYTGDWDLYLFDTKGTMLAAAETVEAGNTSQSTEKLSWKKAKKGQKVVLVACNWGGLKDGVVSYSHTY